MQHAPATVLSTHCSKEHSFTKAPAERLELEAGVGVVGDAHAGAQVQHRSRVTADPTRPNLRQVHLIHSELFESVRAAGFDVGPGDLGENITTRNVDLLALPVGSILAIGPDVVLSVTGLRNPCAQIDSFRPGLLSQVVVRDPAGALVRLAGVMSVVIRGGTVRRGDDISVALPPTPHHQLGRV
ncbi:MAG: MOSC domain-containing protein [Actinomycetota bacterium]